jgi:hypothetical protein
VSLKKLSEELDAWQTDLLFRLSLCWVRLLHRHGAGN